MDLFYLRSLRDFLCAKRELMFHNIDTMDSDTLFQTPEDKLCDSCHKEHAIQELQFVEEPRKIDAWSSVTDTEVSITFAIPFKGDVKLFETYPLTGPKVQPVQADVSDHEILVKIHKRRLSDTTDVTDQKVREELDSVLANIKASAKSVNKQVRTYNEGIREAAAQRIEQRRQQITDKNDLLDTI